ncbi:MAG: ribbon-helix-helix domain-containing protein [Devosia sp.]|nr:ribbon-helix-helix domain-containing protein [Devosia sp.]
MQKRSLSIAGHRTSIALEPEFWAGLDAIATERHLPLSALIREIDETRQTPNLSSALRVAVLSWCQQRVTAIESTAH